MSTIIAALLMQAAPVENKTYYNADGFIVISGSNSCFLSITYETGIDTHILASDSDIYLILSKNNWNPVADKRYKFKIDFGDEYYDLTTTARKDGSFVVSLHPDFLSSYAASGSLDISWGSNLIASLNLSGSSKSITAFRSCMKDKGITLSTPLDKSVHSVPVRDDPFDRSEPARLRYYIGDAYPDEASGSEGVVKTSVKVGANGRAIDCKVLETSGSNILDETACKGLRRSSFHVAKDKAGQPIESVIELPIRFEDPKKTVEPD
jgi:TonB family protein